MRIRISAEPPEPKIVEFNKEDASLVEFDDSKLSQNTWDEFKAWHNKYAPYTDIKDNTELLRHKTLLETLDNEGITLTRKIAKEWTDLNVDKFFYYSYGFYYAVSVDRKSNEIKIEDPAREDWTK